MSQTSSAAIARPIVHHIPFCPFSQRLEILMELKGAREAVDFRVVDITKPRAEHLLKLSGGTTALPIMELEGERALKESLVLMHYLEDRFPEPAIRRDDPYERGLESLLITLADPMISAGYRLVLNQARGERDAHIAAYLDAAQKVDAFLRAHSKGDGPWLFDRFGWAEVAFTPFFLRFAFIPYYEGIDLPEDGRFDRLIEWRAACAAHPAAQQTSEEEILKVYYDYAMGTGNGGLPPGREVSSFAFEPHWKERPMPPRSKYEIRASDLELGLLPKR